MRTACFDPLTMRQARIGNSLRQVYNTVTESPLPDSFDQLLEELDRLAISSDPS